MIHELDPSKKLKELGELNRESERLVEQTPQENEDRPLDTVKGIDLPLPSSRPELGDIKYGK